MKTPREQLDERLEYASTVRRRLELASVLEFCVRDRIETILFHDPVITLVLRDMESAVITDREVLWTIDDKVVPAPNHHTIPLKFAHIVNSDERNFIRECCKLTKVVPFYATRGGGGYKVYWNQLQLTVHDRKLDFSPGAMDYDIPLDGAQIPERFSNELRCLQKNETK